MGKHHEDGTTMNKKQEGDRLEANPVLEMNSELFGNVLGKLGLDQVAATPAAEGEAEGDGAADDKADADAEADADEAAAEADADADAEADADEEKADADAEADADEDEAEGTAEGEEDHLLKKARLTPEQQAAVNKRIGKEVGKRKALEEQLAAIRSDAERQEVELKTLREKTTGATAAAQGVNPLFMVSDEGELDKRYEQVDDFVAYLEEHEDGVEPSEDGKTKGLTREQVRDQLKKYRRERDMVIPKAREVLKRRLEIDRVETRVVYPDLFNPKSAAHQEREAILRQVPMLGMFPEGNLAIGDMLLGRIYRAELKKQQQTKKAGAGAPAAKAKPAPRLPTSPAGGGAKAPGKTGGAKTKNLSATAVVAAGGDRDALVSHLTGIL
jgi:hypothetical protein